MAEMRRILVFLAFCILKIFARNGYNWDHPSHLEFNLVTLARIRAEKDITETERINDAKFIPRPPVCPCPFDVINKINKELPPTRKIVGPAILKIDTLTKLKEISGLSVDEVTTDPRWLKAWEKVFPCEKPPLPNCNTRDRYRTFDGSCNNLKNPLLGTPFQPQSRFLPPEYVGDVELPRTRSLQNERLPRVRPTSNIMNSDNRGTCLDEETAAVLSWGILVITDLIETPTTSTDHRGREVTCCRRSAPRRECFDIGVAKNDPFFNITCLGFVRASPTLADQCKPGRRQQINQLNSYLDASFVYGLTQEDNEELRVFWKGLLKVNKDNIPEKQKKPTLDEVITQTALFRLHNKYATQLSKINRHWNDEKIFQETRKIVGAVVQKITYDEYLPTFLNDDTREKYCLKTECMKYDENEDPQVRVGFSVAAGRFSHSRIPNLPRFVYGIRRTTQAPTSPICLEQLVDDMLHERAACVDRKFEDFIRNRLFMDRSGRSKDLLAMNLERARDTALPPYNRWREYCGLPQAQRFDTGPGGLVDHTKQNARILERAYEKTEFIDLYTGGLSETPLSGARVGPTFSCILAKQFKITKVADRFFWNRKARSAFTSKQRRSINKITFAKVICETYKRRRMQRDAFRVPSQRNPLVSCDDLPDIDLTQWREKNRRY